MQALILGGEKTGVAQDELDSDVDLANPLGGVHEREFVKPTGQ